MSIPHAIARLYQLIVPFSKFKKSNDSFIKLPSKSMFTSYSQEQPSATQGQHPAPSQHTIPAAASMPNPHPTASIIENTNHM